MTTFLIINSRDIRTLQKHDSITKNNLNTSAISHKGWWPQVSQLPQPNCYKAILYVNIPTLWYGRTASNSFVYDKSPVVNN